MADQVRGRSRTFRVFVSSTFEDFRVERDVLRRDVWPHLRRLCAAGGARFQPIDLRWGVSEEAAIDQQTMTICLGEIDRCQSVTPRPAFLVLLGNRYGWRPPPPQVPAEELLAILGWLEAQDPGPQDWPGIDESLGLPTDPEPAPDPVPVADELPLGELVRRWYERDDNAVPPVYRLRPRQGGYVAAESWNQRRTPTGELVWGGLEKRLVRALGAAAMALPELDPQARSKYLSSATAQEIVKGALEVADPDQAVCYVRDISVPQEVARSADPRLRVFVDQDQGRLLELRGALTRVLGEQRVLTGVPVPWAEDAPLLDLGYRRAFATAVRTALEDAIRDELSHPRAAAGGRPAGEDALDQEVRDHLAFAQERRAHFTGRAAELARIAAYVAGAGDRPLVVHGEGGSGKSAVLAEALARALADSPAPVVVARFVGATPSSTDERGLLSSLVEELSRLTGEATAVPTDYAELVALLPRILQAAAGSGPLLVVVDSLDQLSGPAGAGRRSLAWVPGRLPTGVRMLLSTRPGESLDPLRGRAELLSLEGLTRPDGERLLTTWLELAHRTLQPRQRDAVLEAFDRAGGNPLYLRLATEEARRWSSGNGEPPEELSVGVPALVRDNLLHRLAAEDSHGPVLVERALGYLAASRHGLTEDELTGLLSRDLEVYGWFLRTAHHLPEDLLDLAREYAERPEQEDERTWLTRVRDAAATPTGDDAELDRFLGDVVPALRRRGTGPELPVVLWSRLSFDLAPYLTERGTETGSLLGFYHRELQEVAASAYATGDRGRTLHGRLADYFRATADPRGDHSWTGAGGGVDVRGLSELPYHLTRAERWDEVEDVLTDFTFLELKAAHVGVTTRSMGGRETRVHTGVFQLQDDYDLALRLMPGSDQPAAGRPRLVVTAVDLGEGLEVRCPHCAVRHDAADWPGRDLSCPNPACGGPLRVNEFVVGR